MESAILNSALSYNNLSAMLAIKKKDSKHMNKELEQQNIEQTPTEGEQQAPPSARDTFMSALRTKYANDNLGDDDDAYYARAMQDYDTEHEWAKETRKSNDELAEKLNNDPYVAGFLADILQGKHPKAALENFPPEFFDVQEGDEGWDNYQTSVAERKARLDADNAAIKEYDENIGKSQPILESYAQKTGRSPEQMAEFFQRFATDIVDPIMKGKITEEVLSAIDKAFGYEEDIAKAEEQGRINGRNESILEKHRRLRAETPDLPDMQGGGAVPQQTEEPQNFISQLARQRGNTQWY